MPNSGIIFILQKISLLLYGFMNLSVFFPYLYLICSVVTTAHLVSTIKVLFFFWSLNWKSDSHFLSSECVEQILYFHLYLHYTAFMFSDCIEMSFTFQTGFTFQSQDLEDNSEKRMTNRFRSYAEAKHRTFER